MADEPQLTTRFSSRPLAIRPSGQSDRTGPCGLDVGMDQTAICVVDDKDAVLLEVAVMTDPETITAALAPYLGR